MKRLIPLLLIVGVTAFLVYYFSTNNSTKSTTKKEQTDFAIADTSDIGTIFIADRSGNSAKLTRTPNGWYINDKYLARKDATELLLNTFKNVYIQRPVANEAQQQVNKIMATDSKKVEIYDLKGKWIKTWYVGHATMDKKGTYMLLETPAGGRSDAPFILDMRGFLGMLNTRFFIDENEWRDVNVFSYPDMGLEEIEVFYPNFPDDSFKIKYRGGNDIELYAYNDPQPISNFDTSLVKDYMLNFKIGSFENYKTGFGDAAQDSIKAATPYQIIKIKDPQKKYEIKIWKLPPGEDETELVGEREIPATEDLERVLAINNDDELALAQRYIWDNFRAPLRAFLKKPVN